MALSSAPPAVRVNLGATTLLLSTQQLQRYPSSLLPSLAADPAVQRNGEICLTLSPADWDGRFHEEEAAFVLELYRSGSLAQACKVLTPYNNEDISSFQQLIAAVDYFQLPTEQVLSAAALAAAIDVAPGPSDLSPQLLILHTLAVAHRAAHQVLQLHHSCRRDLGPWREARYVLAVSKDEQGHTALQPFACAPAAAKLLYQQLHASEQDVECMPVSKDWIGLDGALLLPMHATFWQSESIHQRMGFASVAEIFFLVASFITHESGFRAWAMNDFLVSMEDAWGGRSLQSMYGVRLSW